MSRGRLSVPAAPEVGLLVSAPRVRVIGQVEGSRVSEVTQAGLSDGAGITFILRKPKIATGAIELEPGFSDSKHAGAQ